MAPDWYRREAWSPEDARDFDARLRRSRTAGGARICSMRLSPPWRNSVTRACFPCSSTLRLPRAPSPPAPIVGGAGLVRRTDAEVLTRLRRLAAS